MKKASLLAVALVALTMSARAQWFDFSNNDERYGVGFNVGLAGWNTNYSGLGGGMSLDIMGVYIDFIYRAPEHRYDNHLTEAQYLDSSAYSIHLGYQIPVLSWLRVMPLVGYAQTNYGITDGATINIETHEYTSSFFHDYTVTSGSRRHYFTFGGGLVLTPFRWLDLYGVATNRAVYGGISINMAPLVGFTGRY